MIIMKRLYSFITALLVLSGCLSSLVAQQPGQQLPIDPNVRHGKLSNGLTYFIRHNQLPKERADFYIVQKVGSMLEEENQRGLAHFLEHMAFNGSTNLPEYTMREYTETIGMRFGENLNAYTAFDETVYMLMNAPIQRETVIDSCLLILHDWSGFLSLTDSMVEKERGIIREEWRRGQDAQARIWEQQLPAIYPESRYGHRMPIGTIDVINNFKPDELRDYYHKWYRPDLQAIVVVGDIDVDQIEKKIQTLFADIPAHENPAERVYFPVPDNDEPLVSVATDKEESNTILRIFYKHDVLPTEVKNTQMGFMVEYMKNIASQIMDERYSEILQKANPPFIYAGSVDANFMVSQTKDAWMNVALLKPGEIESAMNTLVNESQRMKQFGFTPSEYERAKSNLLKSYESAYNERDKQQTRTYMQEITAHFSKGEPMPGIEVEYAMMQEIAAAIPVEVVNQFIQQVITDKNLVITLSGPEKEGLTYPSEAELLAMYNKALELPVEPYVETLSNEPLIPELPAPGKITKEIKDPLFDATVWELSNGIKVVLKHTELKKDQVIMTATSPGGTSLFGDEEALNLKMINSVISLGGLGNFSATDLSKAMSGKNASCRISLGQDSEDVNGSASPAEADLKALFELIYLNFTSLRQDDEAYQSLEGRIKSQLETYKLNPMSAFTDSINIAMYGDNPRTKQIQVEDFDKISYPKTLNMVKERFADASDFVFTFVGNIDTETMRPLVEQYLASLPALNRKDAANEANAVTPRASKFINHFKKEMETPKSSVLLTYTGKLEYNQENRVLSQVLKQILDIVFRTEIREKEGATYTIGTGVSISKFPKGSSLLQVSFETDPELQEKTLAIIHRELDKMMKEGPNADDFKRTMDNIHKRYDESLQNNSYWLNVLDTYYTDGVDNHTNYLPLLDSITPEKIQAFSKKLLEQDNLIEVVMHP